MYSKKSSTLLNGESLGIIVATIHREIRLTVSQSAYWVGMHFRAGPRFFSAQTFFGNRPDMTLVFHFDNHSLSRSQPILIAVLCLGPNQHAPNQPLLFWTWGFLDMGSCWNLKSVRLVFLGSLLSQASKLDSLGPVLPKPEVHQIGPSNSSGSALLHLCC